MAELDQNTGKKGLVNEPEKILIIDDESSTRNLFCMFLEAYGYEPLQAENGEQGLEIFRTQKPGIVFTDIKMPGMDGLEVLRQIKSLAPMTEVIVITGYGDMELAVKALNYDATDFINKPIKRESLEKALKRAGQRLELGQTRKKSIYLEFPGQSEARIVLDGNINAFSEPYLWEAYNTCLEKKVSEVSLVFRYSASVNGAGMAALGEIITDAARRNLQVAISGLSSNFIKVFKELGFLEKVEVRT
ncbi:response regulator [Desulfonatronovibrio hydrogenovorans]|uniref:response regulator n=1 Tax=Desulfonatronovibrio hydrogenovorans TaxID=53245 RepID=UPI000691FEC2|nr:response regulator [Desulfonatronovibrio hydrogenovorans]